MVYNPPRAKRTWKTHDLRAVAEAMARAQALRKEAEQIITDAAERYGVSRSSIRQLAHYWRNPEQARARRRACSQRKSPPNRLRRRRQALIDDHMKAAA